MKDPVVTSDGHTYEREAIEDWLRTNDSSPITGEPLPSKAVIPNIQLRVQIGEFLDRNPELRDGGGGGQAHESIGNRSLPPLLGTQRDLGGAVFGLETQREAADRSP